MPRVGDARSSVHWQGPTLPSEQGAHPRHAVARGPRSGPQDLAQVIQGRTFDAENQLIYAAGDPMAGAMGHLLKMITVP